MTCRGSCDYEGLKRIVDLANSEINYTENKARVKLWLYDFFARAVHEGQYEIATAVMVDLKRIENDGNDTDP